MRAVRVASLAVASCLVAACGAPSGSSASRQPTTPTPASSSATGVTAASPSASPPVPVEQPAARCGTPRQHADAFRFTTADGVVLDGAIVGSGTRGVVLAHEYPASLCGWWPYAVFLARRGFRVLLFDFRCFGESECPEGDRRWDLTSDLAAAADRLRRSRTSSVALVGASLGGAAVLIAGSRLEPPVDAVVSLSGEPGLSVIGAPLNAGAAVRRLRAPVLFVVARGDRAVTVAETRKMERDAASSDKHLVVLPEPAGHGWLMLTEGLLTWSPTAFRVAAFLRAHAAP